MVFNPLHFSINYKNILLRNLKACSVQFSSVHSVMSNSSRPHGLQHTKLPAKSLQSCPTLFDLIDGSPRGSAVPGILQARTLEWVAIAFSDQASLSITKSWSLFKLMFIESVMPSNHFILCSSLLLPPSSFSASGSFPSRQFFTSGGQRIGASASASVLPMNIQD